MLRSRSARRKNANERRKYVQSLAAAKLRGKAANALIMEEGASVRNQIVTNTRRKMASASLTAAVLAVQSRAAAKVRRRAASA
jgi:hypothetical protein